jgi:hypothetical protein
LRVDETLRGLERMKIGIGDADVPRNQAVRSDVDLLLGHDKRAIEQSEIADGALTVLSDRERAAGITGNMSADDNGTRVFAAKMPKDLRALAIKSFAKFDIWRDRLQPPVIFDMSILFDVAHEGKFPEL